MFSKMDQILPSCFTACVTSENANKTAKTMSKIAIFLIVTARFSSHDKKRTASIRETERSESLTSQSWFMTQRARYKSIKVGPRLLLVFQLKSKVVSYLSLSLGFCGRFRDFWFLLVTKWALNGGLFQLSFKINRKQNNA